MHSFTHIDAFNKNDTVIQMSRCSFDVHVQQILDTLMNGATLVMLHPRGSIDFEYLCTVLAGKQITFMGSVPSLFHSFLHFVKDYNRQNAIEYIKNLCSGGMYRTDKTIYS
jgi:non-ribosomal peptide synthetase component F